MFVQLYIYLCVPGDIQKDVCVSVQYPCVCQYSYLSISPVVVCLHLWTFGYYVGSSFHHCSYCLYNEHAHYQLTIFTVDIIFSHIDSYQNSFSLKFVHYVSRYCDDFYSTTDGFVFQYFVTTTLMMAPAMVGPPAALGQQDVVLSSPLLLRVVKGIVGLALVLQQLPPSQMPFQAYTHYAIGPPQVSFSIRG